MTKEREPREVEIVHPSYQPSKAELEDDLRVDTGFEEAVDALTKPVRIRHIYRPKRQAGFRTAPPAST